MVQVIKSVCVYCGASNGASDTFLKIATDVGRALGENGVRLVYGGGGIGLMGAVADATLAAGGEVIGIIPEHLQNAELGHRGLTELKIVDTMHTRKRMMFDLSQAFVILPGGMGTLDETFEIITWRLLGMHDKPVVIVNQDGYWSPLLELIEHCRQEGFVSERRDLYRVVADVDEVLPALMESAEATPRQMSRPSRF